MFNFNMTRDMRTIAGCDCDDSLPNADDFCPRNYECKQCKCLPQGL